MTTSDHLRDIADRLELLIGTEKYGEAIDLALETLPLQVEMTLDFMQSQGIYLTLPRNRMLHLYLGNSDMLGRYKVGVTRDIGRRVKDLNSMLTHLAMTPDFEIVHFGFAPEARTRAMERNLLHDLKRYSVGGEWFRHDDVVFEAIFAAADKLWDDYDRFLRNFDITPDIRACNPLNKLQAQTHKSQRAHLDRLTKLSLEWLKTYQDANEIFRQRYETARLQEQRSRLGNVRLVSLFEDEDS